MVPEIWIAFADAVGIPELRRTTRDESDYNKLMRFRLELLDKNNLRLPDIQKVIGEMDVLDGAADFTRKLLERCSLIILSDTFEQFAKPLMAKLGYPALLCNSLITDAGGRIVDYRLRQADGKRKAVAALKSLNMEIFASGDSFNDLAMIREAGSGCLFRPPEAIRKENQDIPSVETYAELLEQIERFLT
ncbi:phosphoserine phosphatase [Spirochaetia bacterium]|nr:phosphoserine phosphatase [Spirochaetia bacterium]